MISLGTGRGQAGVEARLWVAGAVARHPEGYSMSLQESPLRCISESVFAPI